MFTMMSQIRAIGRWLFLRFLYRSGLFQDRFQLVHGKRIVRVAEMAVHAHRLSVSDHLLDILFPDADQGFFHTLFTAVAVEPGGELIIDLQPELAQYML